MLLTFGASVKAGDRLHGNTALHWAVQAKNTSAASVLVNHGSDIDTPNAQVRITNGAMWWYRVIVGAVIPTLWWLWELWCCWVVVWELV